MKARFSLVHWAAWAPGITEEAAWKRWFEAPFIPFTDNEVPRLAEMSSMMRRRVERLGRMALQTAYWGVAGAPSCPAVFASRYGDMARTTELLECLVRDEPLSPAGFSTSVHNAIAALFSIARGDTGNYTSIAAGTETVEAAFTEAAAMLDAGAAEVLVVYYDEPLPARLLEFPAGVDFPRAWACRITAATGDNAITLESMAADVPPLPVDLPVDMDVLRFLVSGAALHERVADGRKWRWQRHAGPA